MGGHVVDHCRIGQLKWNILIVSLIGDSDRFSVVINNYLIPGLRQFFDFIIDFIRVDHFDKCLFISVYDFDIFVGEEVNFRFIR